MLVLENFFLHCVHVRNKISWASQELDPTLSIDYTVLLVHGKQKRYVKIQRKKKKLEAEMCGVSYEGKCLYQLQQQEKRGVSNLLFSPHIDVLLIFQVDNHETPELRW